MCDPFPIDDPCHVGLEWVRARLSHDPRTRPLAVQARAAGPVLILEGRVGSLSDKQVAGVVARKSQHQGWLDNQIVVVESSASALLAPLKKLPRERLVAG